MSRISIIGFLIVFSGAVSSLVLTFNAAAASHLDFLAYAMLSKLGIFVMVWNYSPLLMIAFYAVGIIGMGLIYAGHTGSTYNYRIRRPAPYRQR